MTNQVPADGLHPNIARIAAAYDIILEKVATKQLTVAQARAQIAQLEARDDQGVRWTIDPDNGRYVRKTALGAEEYDVPPVFGYQTHDAFSYTQPNPEAAAAGRGTGPRVENPNTRLEMFVAPMADPQFTTPPNRLAGATRNGPALGPAAGSANLLQRLLALPTAAKAALVAAVTMLLAVVFFGFGGHEEAPSAPTPVPSTNLPHVPAPHSPAAAK